MEENPKFIVATDEPSDHPWIVADFIGRLTHELLETA